MSLANVNVCGLSLIYHISKIKNNTCLGEQTLTQTKKKTATIRKDNRKVRAVMSVQKDFVCVYQTLKALK